MTTVLSHNSSDSFVPSSTGYKKDVLTIDTFLNSSAPEMDEETEYRSPTLDPSPTTFIRPDSEPISKDIEPPWVSDASSSSSSSSSPTNSRSSSPTSPERPSSGSRDEETASSTSTASLSPSRKSIENGTVGVSQTEDDLAIPSKILKRPSLRRSVTSTDENSQKKLLPDRMSKRLSFGLSRSDSQGSGRSLLRSTSAINLSHKNGNRKSKDELWHAYRTLENDYSKFSDKPNSQKVTVVRAYLVPFLRKFDRSGSTVPIGMEELDRRIRTLHRWWSGLLTALRNSDLQTITPQDRPAFLEGISLIMIRSEWRSPPSSLAPCSRKSSGMSSHSTTSLSSASSLYSLQKSVQHNMRTLFTNILTDTLAYVVEKLAYRQSNSIVHFAGKVVAYNFFFCANSAEMLVSLWGLNPAQVRRVLNDYGISRASTDLRAMADDIINDFPVCLHPLGFTTFQATSQMLKRPSKPPVGSLVNWYGPWVPKWKGFDTDLFYVFVKHYHILLTEYMAPNLSATARLCAPGYILVQAQLLTIIDNTIHRPFMNTPEYHHGPSSVTFDDLLSGENAPLETQTYKGPRSYGMAEHRVFVMMRDVTADQKYCSPAMKHYFAETLATLFQSAAKRTRVADHVACVTVCDVLEEALPLLRKFEKISQGTASYINWPFWMDVCKQTLRNENNISELRVFAFLYTVWELVSDDQERKKYTCIDWLLAEETWDKYFLHWCPMVRSYFMRLLCWRIGGLMHPEPSAMDTEVWKLLQFRLRDMYSKFTWMKEQSENGNIPRQLTAPCAPAPNRRITIIQSETPLFMGGKIFSFEGIPHSNVAQGLAMRPPSSLPMPDAPQSVAVPNQMQSLPLPPSSSPERNETDRQPDSAGSSFKRRWSAFKSILGVSSEIMNPTQKTINQAPHTNLNSYNQSRPPMPPPQPRRPSFKFSLEYVERTPTVTRHRLVNQPRLPPQSQEYLEVQMQIDPLEAKNMGPGFKAPISWKYTGRALAEWALIVDEAENFIDRRKSESMTNLGYLDVPALTIESIKKP